jgi:hypothetical protein
MLISKSKKHILFLLALCSCQFLRAQVSGNEADSSLKPSNAYVLHFIPSVKDNVYGIAIGPIGSETICNVTNTRKSYGINLQLIGQGIFIPINRKVFSFEQLLLNPMPDLINQIACKVMHSGILISTFGTYTDISNGFVLSLGFSYGRKINGIAFNLCSGKYITVNGMELGIQNQAHAVNGLQLGLLNRCVQLNGLQIGLWNVNEKRKLPIINW